MKHYLLIYNALFRANVAQLFAYRVNLINEILGSILWAGVSIVLIILLTSRTPQIFGWTRHEILLLTGISNIFVSVFYFFFSRSFDRFSYIIHLGHLDSLLLKPVDTQFLMSFSYMNFSGVFRIFIGIAFTAYVLTQMNYIPSITSLTLTAFLLFCGIVIMYSIWYIASTLLIWWTNLSNLSGLLYELNTITRFPQQMFHSAKILLYLLLPLTLVVTTPTKTLIEKFEPENMMIILAFAITLLFISRLFWKFALRFYTSASG